MRQMYVYLRNDYFECDEEYLVGCDEDMDWQRAQEEAMAGLREFIEDYRDYHFQQLGIEEPTEEDEEEYVRNCEVIWWPLTDRMLYEITKDSEVDIDEQVIIVEAEGFDYEEDEYEENDEEW